MTRMCNGGVIHCALEKTLADTDCPSWADGLAFREVHNNTSPPISPKQ